MPSPKTSTSSVGLISLGCAKNLVDTQTLASELQHAGLELAPSPEQADILLVNTCSFIGDARDESHEMIAWACARKTSGACRAVLVAGCLPQRYRDEVQQRYPEVDAFLGLDELDRVADILRRVEAGERGILEVSKKPHRLLESRRPWIVFTGGPFAYLKLSDGCGHRCSFCAIPAIRGALRSRETHQVVKEAGTLLEHGIRELNLVAQDVTAFGRDRGQAELPDLLRRLGALSGTFWIRLLYAYPTLVSDELLEAMAEVPQVVPYLDMPLQHTHPEILEAMGRGATARGLEDLPARIRRVLPEVSLRTTFITGYPGETETHFQHMLETVRRGPFDHMGAFTFSPEVGTPAAEAGDRPAPELAEERRQILLATQREVVDRKAAAFIGQTARVLLQRHHPEEDIWAARSARRAPEADGLDYVDQVPPDLKAGQFLEVQYTEQADYDLVAVPVDSKNPAGTSRRDTVS